MTEKNYKSDQADYFRALRRKTRQQTRDMKRDLGSLIGTTESGIALMNMSFTSIGVFGPLIDDSDRRLHTLVTLNAYRIWRLTDAIYDLALAGRCDEADILLRTSMELQMAILAGLVDPSAREKLVLTGTMRPAAMRKIIRAKLGDEAGSAASLAYSLLSGIVHATPEPFLSKKTYWITPIGSTKSLFTMELPLVDDKARVRETFGSLLAHLMGTLHLLWLPYRLLVDHERSSEILGFDPKELVEAVNVFVVEVRDNMGEAFANMLLDLGDRVPVIHTDTSGDVHA